MVETVIDLDDSTLEAMDAAAALMGEDVQQPRQADEFTAIEFSKRINMTPNRARDKLNAMVEAGKMTSRHYRDGQRAFRLYRVADE